ncbi:T10B translocase, partial [Rissa tridactyla]|nr:T10B translocase [Rissa tridactyla]
VNVHRHCLFQLRDFLLVYNRMTELCFRHCVSNLNYRLLTGSEVRPRAAGAPAWGSQGAPGRTDPPVPQEQCLDGCAGKLVHANHRLMRAYVALMPSIMQRRVADYEASVASTGQGPALDGAGGAGPAPDPPAAPGPGGPSQGAPGSGT